MVATLHLLHDVTANASLLTLLTGPRWAIGPRDLRLLSRRAQELAGRRGRRGAERPTIGDQLVEIADGVDPAEIPALDDALADPGRRPPATRPRPASGSRCSPPSCATCAATSASRCSTWCAGSWTPPGSTSSWPRRSARRPRRGATTSTCSSRRSPTSTPSTATSPCRRCWPTSPPRTTHGNGLDLATPTEADSVKLLTVHRAKGLEWAAVFLRRGVRGPVPLQPLAHPVDLVAVGAAGTAARRRRRPAAARRATTRPRSTPTAPRPRPTTPRRSCGWATSRSPGRPTCCRCRPTAGGRAPRRSAPRPTRSSCASCSPSGASPSRPGATSRPRASPTPTPPSTRRGRGRRPRPAPRPRCGSTAAGPWCRRADPARAPTTTSTSSRRPRSREWDAEIERLLAEARRDRGAVVEVPLPSSLSATSLARLRDDADDVRARPGPADAAPAVGRGAVRHPLPRLGRGPLRPARAARHRRAVRPRRRRRRRRRRAAELVELFEKGEFADRVPLRRRAGVRARARRPGRARAGSTRSTATPDGGGSCSSTGRPTTRARADPLQLAIYRLAWAELHGVPLERVRAGVLLRAHRRRWSSPRPAGRASWSGWSRRDASVAGSV